MSEIDELLVSVDKMAEVITKELDSRIEGMRFGTAKAGPEQITALVGNLLKQYPPVLWRNNATGEIVLDSAMMIVLREDPDIVNGKQVWGEIERALKGRR